MIDGHGFIFHADVELPVSRRVGITLGRGLRAALVASPRIVALAASRLAPGVVAGPDEVHVEARGNELARRDDVDATGDAVLSNSLGFRRGPRHLRPPSPAPASQMRTVPSAYPAAMW